MIGGTGFLGYFVCRELAERGHEVVAVGLAQPAPGTMPENVACVALNTDTASNARLDMLLRDADVLIHAAGADGRFSAKPPAIDAFRKSNVDPFFRLIAAMKRTGVYRLVILGSYYTALARACPDLPIMSRSAYPISRAEQAELAFSLAGEAIDVAILEMPYIFGAAPGRGTLWGYVIDKIAASEGPVRVFPGGTACVTARQIGKATAGAAERARGHAAYPIGGVNLSYRAIYTLFADALGVNRTFVLLSPEEAQTAAAAQIRQLAQAGREDGYHPEDLAVLQACDLFLDPEPAMTALGYPPDDIASAIRQTVEATQLSGGAGPASIILE
ncbi:MAG: NAD-dependent epimerase/dehydratase family protein [Erythrobacter sp.]|jgi:nucleoside-diphosphate-sugar epimerase|nr:NAD-dependent epimerase/dehydratase family protein [Erythrobacter sp.]